MELLIVVVKCIQQRTNCANALKYAVSYILAVHEHQCDGWMEYYSPMAGMFLL